MSRAQASLSVIPLQPRARASWATSPSSCLNTVGAGSSRFAPPAAWAWRPSWRAARRRSCERRLDVPTFQAVPASRGSSRHSGPGSDACASDALAAEVLHALVADLFELLQRSLDVGALDLQVLDRSLDMRKQHLRLRDLRGIGIVELEVLCDLFQGEAQILAAQDQLEAGPVATRIGAMHATAHGGDEALRLVEADGPGGHLELLGELADAVEAIGSWAYRRRWRRHAFGACACLWRSCAHLTLAFRRCSSSALSSFLESLPIMVLGRASRNSISAGISILEILASRCLRMSASVAAAPAFNLMNALGASPR